MFGTYLALVRRKGAVGIYLPLETIEEGLPCWAGALGTVRSVGPGNVRPDPGAVLDAHQLGNLGSDVC
jgi:hypothetical protein